MYARVAGPGWPGERGTAVASTREWVLAAGG